MTLFDACGIKISDYTRLPSFQQVCSEVEKDGICSPHFIQGSSVDICEYVKKADAANQYVRKVWEIPSFEFVLIFFCDSERIIPFSVFNDAALQVMKKYNILSNDGSGGVIDENFAMAVVLMITIGYELRKLYLIRAQVLSHQNKLLNVMDKVGPRRRLSLPSEYAAYHVDMIDEQDGVLCRGFQFERTSGYFKWLDGQNGQDLSSIPSSLRLLLEENKEKSSVFLERHPAADIVQVVYGTKGTTATLHSYGCFPKIA